MEVPQYQPWYTISGNTLPTMSKVMIMLYYGIFRDVLRFTIVNRRTHHSKNSYGVGGVVYF